jgi:hypothetical protein
MASTQFVGLTMPVFTAFGWAGEQAAINYALSQLEGFIIELHARLSTHNQSLFPSFGVDGANQTAYLATDSEKDEGIFFSFALRPMSLQITLTITDRKQLQQVFKEAAEDPDGWYAALKGVPEDWSLRIQQMQADETPPAHYKDILKEDVANLSAEALAEATTTAVYLNGEDRWLAPFYLSRKQVSEQIAAMAGDSPKVIAGQIGALGSLLEWLGEKTRRVRTRRRSTRQKSRQEVRAAAPQATVDVSGAEDSFSYSVELKPLHLRKGFINLTAAHWPFFAQSARTEVREVVLRFGDKTDTRSQVWRLVPNDMARIVLSEAAHTWLEDTFEPGERVEVTAVKRSAKKIEVTLGLG